jgi:deoxyribonuclease V
MRRGASDDKKRLRWPKTVAQARAIQQSLRDRVITQDRLRVPRRVAGIDVGFEQDGGITRAAVVVLDFPSLEPLEHAVVRRKTRFPYVPGYLSFREAPAVLAALQRLRRTPDLIVCDGQGFAHPRRFGLACHLGLLANLPSIGVAKSRLIGEHAAPGPRRGEWVPLIDYVLRCTPRYRLPETTRQAHRLASG